MRMPMNKSMTQAPCPHCDTLNDGRQLACVARGGRLTQTAATLLKAGPLPKQAGSTAASVTGRGILIGPCRSKWMVSV